MKKIFYLSSLIALLAGGSAQAQVTFEAKYSQQIQLFKLSTGEFKYAGYFPGATNQVRVYNQNHSLFRQISVSLPANSTEPFLDYLSDKTFNTTTGLEFMLYYSSNTTGTAYAQVFDESGVSLLKADSCGFVDIYNSPAGTKLITYQQTRSGGSYSKVYGLGGVLTPLKVRAEATTLSQPFPNPATDQIQLPYSGLQRGEVATLTIVDAAGRQIESYQVDSMFDHLLLNTRSYRPGTYIYRVATKEGTRMSRRFSVNR
ncbi:MAG TPA: T9SS type A sorting domain-containing protein [Hymenobacter sp.]|jgi:hypothetical protein